MMKYSASLFTPQDNESDFEHSQRIDDLFKINLQSVENGLKEKYESYFTINSYDKDQFGKSQAWIGLDPQQLQTPYCELNDIFKILSSFELRSCIDLGAGYGRSAIVFKNYFPSARYLGVEIVKERVDEGNKLIKRLSLSDTTMICSDIIDQDFNLDNFDVYFLYDFSHPHHIRLILNELQKRFESDEKFFLIARGRATRSIVQNNYPCFYRLYSPIHSDKWSLYSTYCEFDQ